MTGSAICTVQGCGRQVTKPTHTLCLAHWMEAQRQSLPGDGKAPALLTPKALGEHFGLSGTQINRVLAELGWIEREGSKGWKPTGQGIKLCADASVYRGNAFVRWPEGLLSSRILQHAVAVAKGDSEQPCAAPPSATVFAVQEPESPAPCASSPASFRGRFEAGHWATDGHAVRSKGEMLIDNWLYYSGVVHAYERRLPIDEEVYCDFYLPQGKVYIEYWGLDDVHYQERKKAKQAIYRDNELQLIELGDEQVKSLDDVLPPLLRKFGIVVD